MVEVSVKDIVGKLGVFMDRGFDMVLIGGGVFDLKRKKGMISDDLDFFVKKPDPLVEEDVYYDLADENGWDVAQTWLGTPRIILDNGFPIDFYSNFMEFEFPLEFVDGVERIKVSGVELKVLRLEENLLLKLRASLVDNSHFDELRVLLKEFRKKVVRDRVYSLLQSFSEDNRRVMERMLRELGL